MGAAPAQAEAGAEPGEAHGAGPPAAAPAAGRTKVRAALGAAADALWESLAACKKCSAPGQHPLCADLCIQLCSVVRLNSTGLASCCQLWLCVAGITGNVH